MVISYLLVLSDISIVLFLSVVLSNNQEKHRCFHFVFRLALTEHFAAKSGATRFLVPAQGINSSASYLNFLLA